MNFSKKKKSSRKNSFNKSIEFLSLGKKVWFNNQINGY